MPPASPTPVPSSEHSSSRDPISSAASVREALGAMVAATFFVDAEPQSIVQTIIADLSLDIIEGRLAPGSDLNSVEVARRFNSSRTPVREALLALERSGMVEILPRRRPRVATITLRQVHETWEIRAQLYALVAQRVVAHATADDLVRLGACQDLLEDAAAQNDVDAYFWRTLEFRDIEAVAAGNQELRSTLNTLGLPTFQLRHLSLSLPGRLSRSVGDHRDLLRAYAERDEALAVAITRAMTLRGLRALEQASVLD